MLLEKNFNFIVFQIYWSILTLIIGLSPSSLMAEKEFEKTVTETTPLTDVMRNGPAIDDLPKASQVECVRIEKRKCGCCSIQ